MTAERRDYALEHRVTIGIFGGLSERQRRKLRRQAIVSAIAADTASAA